MTPVLSVADVAALLKKSEDWVAAAARSGRLPGRKTGRTWAFTEDDITEYLESVRTGVKPTTATTATRRRRRVA